MRRFLRTALIIALFSALCGYPFAGYSQERNKPEVVAAVLRNWPPHYLTDPNSGELKGFAVDVMNKVAEIGGFRVRYVVFKDWPDALDAFRKHRAVLLPNMGITEKRQEQYDFTMPYETFRISVFIREATSDIHDLEQLRERNVGAVETNQGVVLLKKMGVPEPQLYKSPEEMFMGLLSGAVDAVVYPEQVLMGLARNSKLEGQIKIIGPPLKEIKRGIAVRKGEPELFQKLDGAVHQLVKRPEFQAIYEKWHGRPMPFWNVHRVIIAMSVILGAAVAGMFVWRYLSLFKLNRRLEITLAQLKSTEAKFRHVFETANVGKSITLPAGEIYVNRSFADMLGYGRKDLVNKTWQELTPQDEIEAIERILVPIRNGEKDSVRFRKRYIHRDGSFIWADVSTAMQRDKDGNPLYFITTIVDITERIQAEEKLRLSEERFSSAFQLSPAGLTITRIADGRFIDVNESFLHLFGFSREEVVGHTSTDLKMLSIQERDNLIRAQLESEGLRNAEFRARSKSGKMIHILFSSMPMILGGEAYHITTMIDITHRKRAEKALRESEERFKRALENIPDVVVIYDTDSRIRYINKATTRVTGRPESDFIGRREQEIWPPEVCERYMPTFMKSLRTGKIQSVTTDISFPGGNASYLKITCVPLTDRDGKVREILGITQDLTERKQAEAKRLELEAVVRQTQKMESIGNLAGGIAHDFNNILSSIIGFSELALDEVEKGSLVEDNLQEVYAAGKRAKDLVGQILAFARQSEQEMKPVQVDIIVKELLKFIRSSIPSTIEIRQRIESDSLVMGNVTQIHQVLMNLCTNAAYAMEEGGGILDVCLRDITVESGKQGAPPNVKPGNYLELKISDTGSGIPNDIIGSIFEPYFTTKATGEGTGLGLAVVHGIVESHGGKITVDSQLGEGCVFTVYLPMTKKRKRHASYETGELPSGSERILFVDDEASIAKMGSLILARLGYEVAVRTSSIEALELFRSKPNEFDLVITDMTMPNMTGDNLGVELMKIRPDIPVILCTGYSRKISDETAAGIGLKAFVHKPIVKSALAKTVRKVLDAHQDQS